MFGYRLIKDVVIEDLKSQLDDANETITSQMKEIAKLIEQVKERDCIIANLSKESATVKNEIVEEKPIKKVRRKNTKKTTKKEE